LGVMNLLLKFIERIVVPDPEEEMQEALLALLFLVIFAPVYFFTSRLVHSNGLSIAISLTIAGIIYGGIWFYFRRAVAQPESDVPSPLPLAELSRYQLFVEKEKAQRAKNEARLRAVEAEVAQRG
jgi:hypothetical protein